LRPTTVTSAPIRSDHRRVGVDHAATQDQHFAGQDSRHATEQHAATTAGLLQQSRPDLRRHAARDLGHRREQRQRARRVGHRLIGDCADAGRHQRLGLLAVGREVEIGEEDFPALEQRALGLERLLDLHDQIGAFENLGRVGCDLRAGRDIVGIRYAGAVACILLHHDAVAAPGELAHRRGHQAHAVFVVFDFLGYSDEHA
jgi:hypothetical protein